MEKKMKQKNDTIYQLEMKIIHIEKTYSLNLSNLPYNAINTHHNPSYNLNNYNYSKRYTPINMIDHNNSLKYSPTINKGGLHHTPNHGNKN